MIISNISLRDVSMGPQTKYLGIKKDRCSQIEIQLDFVNIDILRDHLKSL